MFCTKCGVENPEAANFCHACGHNFGGSSNAIPRDDMVLGTPSYAGFWQRFAAAFVDGLIVSLITIPVLAIIFIGASPDKSAQLLFTGFAYVLVYVISAIYFTVMESGARSATYGKRWLGLKVYDLVGGRISSSRAFVRWISHFFSYITFYIGFLVQPFTARKQALHDMISSTVVVDTNKRSSAGIVVGVVVGIFVFIAIVGILAAIAIPAYQDYVTKAKVVQAYSLAQSATVNVEQYYINTKKIPATLAEAGFNAPPTTYASRISISPETGEIYVVFTSQAGSAVAAKHLILTPQSASNGMVWKCYSNEIQAKYLPQACR